MGVRSASQALPSVTLSLRFLTEAATPLELRLRTLRAKKALFRAPSRISSTEHIRRGELVLSLCHASSERPVIVCAREKNLPRPAHGRVLRESYRHLSRKKNNQLLLAAALAHRLGAHRKWGPRSHCHLFWSALLIIQVPERKHTMVGTVGTRRPAIFQMARPARPPRTNGVAVMALAMAWVVAIFALASMVALSERS